MDSASRTRQWKSCPKGHNYLGDRCPCEQANRYTAKSHQTIERSPSPSRVEIGEMPEGKSPHPSGGSESGNVGGEGSSTSS